MACHILFLWLAFAVGEEIGRREIEMEIGDTPGGHLELSYTA
jgi:hypothetical protein